jgi:hypothetical protein
MFARYWLPLLLAVSFSAHAEVGIRLLVGVTNTKSTKWDGSAPVDRGGVFRDAASLDWAGYCNHEDGDAREYSLWTTPKAYRRLLQLWQVRIPVQPSEKRRVSGRPPQMRCSSGVEFVRCLSFVGGG